ncbi:MAG: S9 family peptidase, partial [Halieaceae bacterium]|nr:S9 family peptidase [Halieaceae bacterium]
MAQPADPGSDGTAGSASPFSPMDVFDLEWAQSPRISPDGRHVVYRRSGFDVLGDRRRGNLWLLETGSAAHRKLTDFEGDESSPRWAPDGSR